MKTPRVPREIREATNQHRVVPGKRFEGPEEKEWEKNMIDEIDFDELLIRLGDWRDWEAVGYQFDLLKEAIAAIETLRERLV